MEYMRNRGAEDLHVLSKVKMQELTHPAALLTVKNFAFPISALGAEH